MKPTATQILQRCKDIVEGNYPENGREVYQAGAIFTITYNLFSVSIQEGSGDSSFERAAFLLGMDSEPAPAPEIVLEWAEDEYGRPSAKYNENVAGICFQIGILWFAYIEISEMQSLRMTPGQFNLEDAQKWCADTIKSITTQAPKQ